MSTSLFELQDKTALITGATGHLGRVMAKALAGAGARVLVNSRSQGNAAVLVSELRGQGWNAEPAVFDVSDSDQVSGYLNGLQGPLHVLVNNAYVGGAGTIRSASASAYTESYGVAMVAAHQLVQKALPLLQRAVMEHRDASIINIASMYGMVSPDPRIYAGPESTNPPFYGAAKAALLQWTRYAACEFGPLGIRVNAISPGPFPPDAVHEAQPEFIRKLAGKVPLGRTGSSEEIAGPLLFLASSASSFVTGGNLVVDGGWTAW